MLTRRQLALTLLAAPTLATLARAGTAGFSFDSIDGGRIRLDEWRGTPVMVVNTASQCAFTPQYEALQALHEEFAGRAHVLAVPSDDFGGQELDSEAEVKDFCDVNFGLTLPMTGITRVLGADAHPFYRWAAAQGVVPRWNFHKILLDRDGRIAGDFPSMVRPDSARLRDAIRALG